LAKRKNIAIILAGGTGSRFGLEISKQFAKLAGKSIVEYTIEAFDKHDLIDEIAIVAHKDWIWKFEEFVEKNSFKKVNKILVGGNERKDSTLSALKAYENSSEKINFILHDAVRPFVSKQIINDCIEALQEYNAVDVAIPATDTIIEVQKNIISNIPNREFMQQGQTPQCFKYETLKKSYDISQEDKNFKPTDDCGIVKKYLLNEKIYVVNSELTNMKITHPLDIFIADKIIQLKSYKVDSIYPDSYYQEKLKDKVIVIFGGSKGIGYSIKELASKFGAKVYSFSKTETNTDVAIKDNIKEALSSVYSKENRIDYVVNTASILIKKPLLLTTEEDIQTIININYLGAVNIAKESIQYLEESHGQILNFTSSSYTRGRANYSLYSSTKVAIVNLTQALGDELSNRKIRVNCINPERTLTPMRVSSFGKEDPKTLLSPEEVAYISINNTLLSDITGQIVDVKLQKHKVS